MQAPGPANDNILSHLAEWLPTKRIIDIERFRSPSLKMLMYLVEKCRNDHTVVLVIRAKTGWAQLAGLAFTINRYWDILLIHGENYFNYPWEHINKRAVREKIRWSDSEDGKKHWECVVCLEEIEKSPLTACCGQSICLDCMKAVGMSLCPMCRGKMTETLVRD
jgi:hypothetical protein